MNRFVIYYLQKYKGIPRAVEYAQQQIRGLSGDGTVVATTEEFVRVFETACTEAAVWDEIILMTDDLVGPIGAERLDAMLEGMAALVCDAWGLARGYLPDGQLCKNESGTLSVGRSFIALRKKLFCDSALNVILNACEKNPMEVLAEWIENSDLNYECWVADNKEIMGKLDPLSALPYTSVVKFGSPFVDIRCFRRSHTEILKTSMGEETVQLYRLLTETDSVNMDWLWDRLLTDTLDYNLIENLGLVSCKDTGSISEAAERKESVCLLLHLYYPELGQEALHYASNMPEDADIFITTSSAEKRAYFSGLFSQLPNKVEVRVVENRGRDMAGLLIGLRDVTSRYDVCCFYHDKKSPANAEASVGRSFAYMISESALASRGYVERILQKFQDEPRLGLLCPMVPHHGDYYLVATHFWDHNYPYVMALLEKLGLNVSVNENSCVPVAWGNVFWFRSKALRPLLDYPWKYEDFPEEPYPIDGSIAHAIERAHCLIAQSQGYYTGLVAPDHLMALQMANFFQYWQDYANEMVQAQIIGPHSDVVRYCGKCLTCTEVKAKQKIHQWIQRARKRLGM